MVDMKNKSSNENFKAIYVFVALILTLFSTIYVVRFGIVCDIWLLCTQQLQTYKGLVPLKDVWGPFSVSSWFIANLLRLPNVLMGGRYVLASKVSYVLMTMISVLISAHVLKKCIGKNKSFYLFWGLLLFYLFLPDYLYSFLCHYTIDYNIVMISCALLIRCCDEESRLVEAVVLSGLTFIGILVMPQYVIVALIIFIILLTQDIKNRRGNIDDLCKEKHYSNCLLLTPIYVSVIILFGGIFLAYLVCSGGRIWDIFHLLSDTTHQESLLIRFIKRCLVVLVIVFGETLFYFIMKKAKRLSMAFTILCAGAIVLWGIAAITFRNLILMMRIGYASVMALGLWCCFYEISNLTQYQKEKFRIFISLGFALAFSVGTFTDTGAIIMAMGYMIPLSGYIILRDTKSKYEYWNNTISVTLLILLLLGQRFILINGSTYTTANYLKNELDTSFVAGQYVDDNSFRRYEVCSRIMREYTDIDDVILILNGGIYETGYGMTEALVGVSDYYSFDISNNNYMRFWETHEYLIPNKIFLFRNDDKDNLLIENRDLPIVEYIFANYEESLISEDVIIYKLKED